MDLASVPFSIGQPLHGLGIGVPQLLDKITETGQLVLLPHARHQDRGLLPREKPDHRARLQVQDVDLLAIDRLRTNTVSRVVDDRLGLLGVEPWGGFQHFDAVSHGGHILERR